MLAPGTASRKGVVAPLRIIDNLATKTQAAARRLRLLEVDGYDDDDVGVGARDTAAVWERSLKACNTRWQNMNLYSITEELVTQGWTGASALHTIRQAANADKHDASPTHDLASTLSAISTLESSLAELTIILPAINSPLPARLRRRRMICAMYDYFTQGETEYVFLLAVDGTWMTSRAIDSFQVRNRDSAAIEAALAQFDGWVFDPPEFELLRASLQESDNELWRIAVFTASYQDILDLLTPYQHDMELLPGLHREDRKTNTVASVLASYIAGHAQPTHGLTGRNQEFAEWVSERIHRLFERCPLAPGTLRLDRCGLAVFDQLAGDALVVDRDLGVLIQRDGLALVLEER